MVSNDGPICGLLDLASVLGRTMTGPDVERHRCCLSPLLQQRSNVLPWHARDLLHLHPTSKPATNPVLCDQIASPKFYMLLFDLDRLFAARSEPSHFVCPFNAATPDMINSRSPPLPTPDHFTPSLLSAYHYTYVVSIPP